MVFLMTSAPDALTNACVKVLEPYQQRLNDVFESVLPEFRCSPVLGKACEYAMQAGGKRLRPAIVWMVAEALQSKRSVDLAALAVEFFHISSLVTDDLPCMDNDDFRRGVPTVHKVFPEAVAVLTSFALTAAGFESVVRIPLPYDVDGVILRTAVLKASRAIGVAGLVGGQVLDLAPPNAERSTLDDIINKKTAALFELSFVFGWIFGGGSIESVDEIARMARSFGRAFQVVDDIMDVDQDRAAKKQVNYAVSFGLESACQLVRQELESFRCLAKRFRLDTSPLMLLVDAMLQIASSR